MPFAYRLQVCRVERFVAGGFDDHLGPVDLEHVDGLLALVGEAVAVLDADVHVAELGERLGQAEMTKRDVNDEKGGTPDKISDLG